MGSASLPIRVDPCASVVSRSPMDSPFLHQAPFAYFAVHLQFRPSAPFARELLPSGRIRHPFACLSGRSLLMLSRALASPHPGDADSSAGLFTSVAGSAPDRPVSGGGLLLPVVSRQFPARLPAQVPGAAAAAGAWPVRLHQPGGGGAAHRVGGAPRHRLLRHRLVALAPGAERGVHPWLPAGAQCGRHAVLHLL